MGSSFAYIGAMTLLMKNGGMPAIAQGAMTGGLVYLIVALIVKFAGKGWIDKNYFGTRLIEFGCRDEDGFVGVVNRRFQQPQLRLII